MQESKQSCTSWHLEEHLTWLGHKALACQCSGIWARKACARHLGTRENIRSETYWSCHRESDRPCTPEGLCLCRRSSCLCWPSSSSKPSASFLQTQRYSSSPKFAATNSPSQQHTPSADKLGHVFLAYQLTKCKMHTMRCLTGWLQD